MKNIDEKITKLEKELKELKESIKLEKWQDKLVQPSESRYYFITGDIDTGLSTLAIDSNISTNARKPEHAFRTKEQAKLVKEKMLLMQEMLAFAHVKNNGWEADWREVGGKYGIVMIEDEITVKHYILVNSFIFGISVKSKEIAEEMLAIFGERIAKYYQKQY